MSFSVSIHDYRRGHCVKLFAVTGSTIRWIPKTKWFHLSLFSDFPIICYPLLRLLCGVTKLSPTEFRFSSINPNKDIFLSVLLRLQWLFRDCKGRETISPSEKLESHGVMVDFLPIFCAQTIIELVSVIIFLVLWVLAVTNRIRRTNPWVVNFHYKKFSASHGLRVDLHLSSEL